MPHSQSRITLLNPSRSFATPSACLAVAVAVAVVCHFSFHSTPFCSPSVLCRCLSHAEAMELLCRASPPPDLKPLLLTRGTLIPHIPTSPPSSSLPSFSFPFHSIPFHSIPFNSIPFHSIPLHSHFHS